MRVPTQEMLAAWEEWLNTRPPSIQNLARRFPPWKVYRLRTTGQDILEIKAYSEPDHENPNGTIRAVCLMPGLPAIPPFLREVFGLDPDDIKELSGEDLIQDEKGR